MDKRIMLKKDLVIPKGTIFESCSGLNVDYGEDNFSAMQGTGVDGVVDVHVDSGVVDDRPDQFEIITPADQNKNTKDDVLDAIANATNVKGLGYIKDKDLWTIYYFEGESTVVESSELLDFLENA